MVRFDVTTGIFSMASDNSELSREVAKVIETAVSKSFKSGKDELDSILAIAELECLAAVGSESETIDGDVI